LDLEEIDEILRIHTERPENRYAQQILAGKCLACENEMQQQHLYLRVNA